MARKTFPLILSDQTYLLDYDWPACGEIFKRFGVTADLFNPEILGEVVVIGMRRHHPDASLAIVHAGSPPMVQVIALVDRALRYAYNGIDPDQPAPAPAAPAPAPEDAV